MSSDTMKPEWVSQQGLEYCSRIMRVAAEGLVKPSSIVTRQKLAQSMDVIDFLELASRQIFKGVSGDWQDANRATLANLSLCLLHTMQAISVLGASDKALKQLALITCKIMAANAKYLVEWEFPHRVVVQTASTSPQMRAALSSALGEASNSLEKAREIARQERGEIAALIQEVSSPILKGAVKPRRPAAVGYELKYRY